ncbi:DsbA family protein [Pseudonocardia asaccharolytica]|uniref:Membrane protein n=1 Tax=Pseudonocardia asaccharolytica DSM 44247 = NBRC 16224 TaxID=1123024 RepID=A0A511D4U6_9PSEU|nr:thioredoxin domain-containing protein [Pseudonocardia asaccharolytica]GEL18624.1 membrane protein [Pseudonocardia asaccharolytica DSM 44247 = NBRC 16224]
MGGASRNERQRRQEAARQRLAAAGITPKKSGLAGTNRTSIILVAIVVVVAVAVGVGVWLSRTSTEPVAANYPVALDGTAVAAGQANAPITIDVYEDYLCPVCERFETTYGPQLATALNEGKIKVNYHSTSILDRFSNPPGYSTLAANAGMCAVPAGIWPAFHKELFDTQPAEGGPGFTAAQLVEKGNALGATGDWQECVTSNRHAGAITAATNEAAANPALQTDGQFGTPTVAINGQKIDLGNRDWLKEALGQG